MTDGATSTLFVPVAVLPGDPPRPCPELLTAREAVCYLRLDTIAGLKNPLDTLDYYRTKRYLRGTQVSKAVMYLRSELDRFLAARTEENPR